MNQTVIAPEKSEEELKEEDRYLHCFCMICNLQNEIAISMCGAKSKPVASLKYEKPEGIMCVVCDELMRKVCQGCGF